MPSGGNLFCRSAFLKAAYGIHASHGTRTSMYIAQERFAEFVRSYSLAN